MNSALNGLINPRQSSKTSKLIHQQPNKTFAPPSFPNTSVTIQKNASYTQTESKFASQLIQ